MEEDVTEEVAEEMVEEVVEEVEEDVAEKVAEKVVEEVDVSLLEELLDWDSFRTIPLVYHILFSNLLMAMS